MREIFVTFTPPEKSEKDYKILIENNLLQQSGVLIRQFYQGRNIAVITDSNVEKLYAKPLLQALQQSGYCTKLVSFPAGEGSKNMQTLQQIYSALLTSTPFSVTRGDLIIALGGGVCGDIAGFAAATLFRGIPFIQIPTTLLAQVDSSVGGKVAVDLPQGKNLAGSFYQPKCVIIDPLCLQTLPDRTFFDGLAEVIKYAMILKEDLFALLEKCKNREEITEKIESIIADCCTCKRSVVQQDEQDTGIRMLLNFGHTFGHAYEKYGRYEKYMHGEAISAGMVKALEIGEKLGYTNLEARPRLIQMLQKFSLPVSINADKKALQESLCYDKKGSGELIRLVLCENIGKADLYPMEKNQLLSYI